MTYDVHNEKLPQGHIYYFLLSYRNRWWGSWKSSRVCHNLQTCVAFVWEPGSSIMRCSMVNVETTSMKAASCLKFRVAPRWKRNVYYWMGYIPIKAWHASMGWTIDLGAAALPCLDASCPPSGHLNSGRSWAVPAVQGTYFSVCPGRGHLQAEILLHAVPQVCCCSSPFYILEAVVGWSLLPSLITWACALQCHTRKKI